MMRKYSPNDQTQKRPCIYCIKCLEGSAKKEKQLDKELYGKCIKKLKSRLNLSDLNILYMIQNIIVMYILIGFIIQFQNEKN